MENIKQIIKRIEELNKIKTSLMNGALFSFKELLSEIEVNFKQIAITENEIRELKKNKDDKENKQKLEYFKIYPYSFSYDVYKNKLTELYSVLDQETLMEIHHYYKNLEFLEESSKKTISTIENLKVKEENQQEDLPPIYENPQLKQQIKQYEELEKRTKQIGESLIKRLNNINQGMPSILLARDEFDYIVEDSGFKGIKKDVKFFMRKFFNSVNKNIPDCNTSIEHNYVGEGLEFYGYTDIDLKSNYDPRFKPIKLKESGQELKTFLEEKEIKNAPNNKHYRFGVKCHTDMKENDFYWIEIYALFKKMLKKRNGEYFTRIHLTFGAAIPNSINVKIPRPREALFRQHIIEITKALPTPNFTYEDSKYKVFTWNQDTVYKNQRYTIDLYFKKKVKYTPFLKYLISALIGAFIAVLFTERDDIFKLFISIKGKLTHITTFIFEYFKSPNVK